MKLGAVSSQWFFIVINFLLFQVGWAVAVLWGSVPAAVYLVVGSSLHFWQTHSARFDLVSGLLMVSIGVAHDSLLLGVGIIQLDGSLFPPFWLVSLWFLLGLTLNHSLQAIYKNRWLAMSLSPFGGVFAYLAGIRLSEADWGHYGQWGLLFIAALWVFVLPLHKFLIGLIFSSLSRQVHR